MIETLKQVLLQLWADDSKLWADDSIILSNENRTSAITNLRNLITELEKAEPVAEIEERTELRRISGADMGLGCSDGFVTDRWKQAKFYPVNPNDRSKFAKTFNEVLPIGTKLYTHPFSIPPGWQLVPVDLPDETNLALGKKYGYPPCGWKVSYRQILGMLAAAPKFGEMK